MSKQIKILSLTRGSVTANTGTPLRIRNLIYQLSKKENIILYTCSSNDTLSFIDNPKHLKIIKKINFRELIKLIKFIKNNKIEIVVGHTMTVWFYLIAIKFITRIKIVLEMHGFIEVEAYEFGRISKFKYYINKYRYKLFYRYCDLITTCSKTATSILKKYNKNVVTIFGGVDINIFHPIEKNRQDHKNNIVICYAGNPRGWQGLDFLLEAYKKLRQKNPAFILRLLLSEKFDLPDIEGVEYYKRLPYYKVPEFVSNCDILVVPRPATKINKISFPSKLPEDMAMGKAIVASKTADMHEIITDNFDGLLYEPGDLKGLINCLLTLNDPKKRSRLGKNAYETARTKLTWEKQAQILCEKLLSLKK